MTPRPSDSPAGDLEVVERYMREHGRRWTAQRRLIAEVALTSHGHFSAEELLEMCRRVDGQVSRATVYRTLGMLEQAGFVEGLDAGDGGRKFEHVIGHGHHDHMVCRRCGSIVEFHDAVLEARQQAVAGKHGFHLDSHTLRLVGTCQACGSLADRAEPS